MCVEIEAKLKVDSLEQLMEKLSQLGAEFVEEQLQKDCYFDNINSELAGSDKCLRLRQQITEGNQKVFLTYKGTREKSEFKKRQEIELEITDTYSMENLLSVLGYDKVLVFEKKRRLWRLGGCEIALDELPLLGSFVEIEGPDTEKIAGVQRTLALADVPHIPESYADLMTEKLCQIGREPKEAFFESLGSNYEAG